MNCIIASFVFGAGGRPRFTFLPRAKIKVATSVCTGGRDCPPDSPTAMGSSPSNFLIKKKREAKASLFFFGAGCPVAVPDKIFGLTLFLDFIDRCHSLRSLYLPLGSAPIAPPQSAALTAPPSRWSRWCIRLTFYSDKQKFIG